MAAGYEGSCLCGAVRYRHEGALQEVIGCHCSQCRRISGHFVATTQGTCVDPSLFRRREHSGRISIMAGTLTGPTGLGLTRDIHVTDRGDSYRIDPALPCAGQGNVLPDIPASKQQEES